MPPMHRTHRSAVATNLLRCSRSACCVAHGLPALSAVALAVLYGSFEKPVIDAYQALASDADGGWLPHAFIMTPNASNDYCSDSHHASCGDECQHDGCLNSVNGLPAMGLPAALSLGWNAFGQVMHIEAAVTPVLNGIAVVV